MKLLVLCLLFALRAACLAAEDPGIFAAGDWSEPVTDSAAGTLRGRLLLCESPKREKSPAVYLELQECANLWERDLDVYCSLVSAYSRVPAPGSKLKERIVPAAAVWEMRDESGQPVNGSPSLYSGREPLAQWVTLLGDSTVRLRASISTPGRLEDGSWDIFLASDHWLVPARSTHEYFLSCTFTVDPPADHVPLPSNRVWRGTLKLPKLKIPVEKP